MPMLGNVKLGNDGNEGSDKLGIEGRLIGGITGSAKVGNLKLNPPPPPSGGRVTPGILGIEMLGRVGREGRLIDGIEGKLIGGITGSAKVGNLIVGAVIGIETPGMLGISKVGSDGRDGKLIDGIEGRLIGGIIGNSGIANPSSF